MSKQDKKINSHQRNFHHLIIQERDIKLFIQLWKWKMLSTKAIYERFFDNAGLCSCYNRLNRLRSFNYLDVIYIEKMNGFCWTLTSKSYELIKDNLSELGIEGFKSENKYHDFWVTVCHLGEFLKTSPNDFTTISEQQLRRFDKAYFPDWLPNPELHRPDGYWIYQNKDKRKVMSLEVELSEKKKANFDRTITFYEHSTNINAVLWVVNTLFLAKRICERINKHITNPSQKHYFFLLSEIEKTGWNALNKLTENKKLTFSETLFLDVIPSPIQTTNNSMTVSMRDVRLKPNK